MILIVGGSGFIGYYLHHELIKSDNNVISTYSTNKIEEDKIEELVRNNFDMKPSGIISELDLKRPIYKKTAAYGHFGRNEPEFSWEKTDKA